MHVARRPLCAALTVLSLAAASAPAVAQEDDRPLQLLVGVQPGGGYSEIDGYSYNQGFSLGLDYHLSPRWATGLRSTFEGYAQSSSGTDSSAYTLDLAAHYYMKRTPRWGLFSATGLRYSHSDFGPESSRGSATGVLIGIGADYSLSRRFDLRMDATTVPIDIEGNSDRLYGINLGFGIGFRF